MDNLNDLKELWLSADTSALPGTGEMMQAIKKYRSTGLKKKIAVVSLAAFFTAMLVFIVFIYKSVMISTRIGEACMVAAGMMLVYTNIKSLRRLYNVKDHTNKEFIQYLQQVQVNRIYYHSKTQVAGFALVSVGLMLYTYEGVHNILWLFILAYTFLTAYLLVAWLIIRPRAYKRQAKQLEATMAKMKHLADQF
jgi:hypothetical protein